jgi:hypothetical protein
MWAPASVQVTLFPGASATATFSITSDQTLQNVILEAVPAIVALLSVQANIFGTLPANSGQSVRIAFAIPNSAALGTYDGTIHLRAANQTYPQTLKVTVNVWQGVLLGSGGAIVAVPPGWLVQTTATEIGASSPALQGLAGSQDAEVPPEDLLVRVLRKPSSETISQFASEFDGGSLHTYAVKSIITVGGHEAIIYNDTSSMVQHQPPLVALIDNPGRAQAVVVTLSQIALGNASDLFLQILSAIQFQ